MPKVIVTRRWPAAVEEELAARFDVVLNETDEPFDRDRLREALAGADALCPTVTDRLDAGLLLDPGVTVKLLANFGVGYNHIDVEAAGRAGVLVSNTPDVVTDATADIGMTLILSTCRRAGEGERLVRADKWIGWGPTQMLGTHVTGKTVGIVGMGRIGQAVARRCHYGFEMPVLYYNRSEKSTEVPALQVPTLHELMAASDIVVVTVPGGGDNTHLIDGPALAAMKPSGIFVNIARGDVVDEPALIKALQDGIIAGAGLDVFAHEPHVPDEFRALENVVLLPHLGTAALEVREAMGQMALDNIIAWEEGRPLPQAV